MCPLSLLPSSVKTPGAARTENPKQTTMTSPAPTGYTTVAPWIVTDDTGKSRTEASATARSGPGTPCSWPSIVGPTDR